jgi:hypothetical protein
MISFVALSSPPKEWEVQFLYKLLSSREHRISHKRMPSLNAHRSFVANHPYHSWSVVLLEDVAIGAIYTHLDNSVGIHFLPEFRSHRQSVIRLFMRSFSPLPGSSSIANDHFIFNVAMGDLDYENDLRACGAIPLQITYQITKSLDK